MATQHCLVRNKPWRAIFKMIWTQKISGAPASGCNPTCAFPPSSALWSGEVRREQWCPGCCWCLGISRIPESQQIKDGSELKDDEIKSSIFSEAKMRFRWGQLSHMRSHKAFHSRAEMETGSLWTLKAARAKKHSVPDNEPYLLTWHRGLRFSVCFIN